MFFFKEIAGGDELIRRELHRKFVALSSHFTSHREPWGSSNIGRRNAQLCSGLPNKLTQALPLNAREEDEEFGGGGRIQSYGIANLLRIPRILLPIVSGGWLVGWF